MDPQLRERLNALLGADAVTETEVSPAGLAELRAVAAMVADEGVTLRSNAVAALPEGVVINAGRMVAAEVDAAGSLLHAGAAAPWTAVRRAASDAGLAVAALGTVRSDTVGESVAAGEIAHRTIAGVALLTNGGELISAGGRTLKDVVGYDLPGLALGSGTQLGLIVQVTLRLEPRGARTATQAGPGPWRGDAGVAVAAAFSTSDAGAKPPGELSAQGLAS